MIRVENLSKQYAAAAAVADISFEVAEREILGFLGPNGAGKTTTLRMITGYVAPTAGRITVEGRDVFQDPGATKKVIGYMPENVPLYPELRVEEYLGYRAALKGVPRRKRRAAVDGALERCRIGDVRRRIIGQLSKGFRQRVGLADALVADPKILILDEPTIGLDPHQIRQVRDLVRELGKERTVILSSHILPEVEAVCSRVIIIHRGRIVGQGKPDELRARVAGGGTTITVEVLDPAGAAGRALGELPGVRAVSGPSPAAGAAAAFTLVAVADAQVRERIFDAAVKGGFKLVGLGSRGASLEEIFVHITTHEEESAAAPAAEEGGVP